MSARQGSSTLRLAALLLRPLLRAVTRRAWRGAEHLPGGPFLAVANHMTNLDALVVGHYLYDNGAAPVFLAKSELFENRVLGAVLRAAGQVPVHRGTEHAGDALAEADAVLAAGGCVVIFPEGTFTRDPDLWPMTGRTGAARLALRTGVPVVPVAHWGAQDVLPRYGTWPRLVPRHRVTVVAGPPVDLTDLEGREPDREALEAATARLMAAVTGLLADVRGAQPPGRAYDVRRDGDPRAGHTAARASRKAAKAARKAAGAARRGALLARLGARRP